MPIITYVEANGTAHEIDAPVGTTLMQAAVDRMIPGIEGDCGGLCACATCHVYLPPEAAPLTPAAGELESGMLEFAFDVRPESRLACQIEITEAMDGLRVQLPERQY